MNEDFDLNDIITTRVAPGIKWINIVGYEKAGKTRALVELAKHIPSLYVDLDFIGTKPYKGNFLRVGNETRLDGGEPVVGIVDFVSKVMPRMESMNKKILILDPVNEFVELIKSQLMSQFKVDDLKDYSVKGIGNGWVILYSKIQNYFQQFFKAFPLVITVTHLKLDKYFAGDVAAIQGAQLDLTGKTQQYVQRNADAHLVFTAREHEKGRWTTFVNEDNAMSMIKVPLGSRDYEFLKHVVTADDLIVEIGKMFGMDIVVSYPEPEAIRL